MVAVQVDLDLTLKARARDGHWSPASGTSPAARPATRESGSSHTPHSSGWHSSCTVADDEHVGVELFSAVVPCPCSCPFLEVVESTQKSWMVLVWSMRNSALTGAPSPSCAQVSLLCALVHPSKQTDDQPDSSLTCTVELSRRTQLNSSDRSGQSGVPSQMIVVFTHPPPYSHWNSPGPHSQPTSSSPSIQSFVPSHFRLAEIQRPSLQRNCESVQVA